jgi:hypothetical protein
MSRLSQPQLHRLNSISVNATHPALFSTPVTTLRSEQSKPFLNNHTHATHLWPPKLHYFCTVQVQEQRPLLSEHNERLYSHLSVGITSPWDNRQFQCGVVTACIDRRHCKSLWQMVTVDSCKAPHNFEHSTFIAILAGWGLLIYVTASFYWTTSPLQHYKNNLCITMT